MASSNHSSEARSVGWNCSSLPPKGPASTSSSSAETAGFPFSPGTRAHHHHHRTASFVVQQSQLPWIDNMLESPGDTGSRKILHRRSSSDSAAFLDVGPSGTIGTVGVGDDSRRDQQNGEEFGGYRSLAFTQLPGSGTNRSSSDLERLDDEQIMSMFTDAEHRCRSTAGASTAAAPDTNAATAATSSPSDSNSGNDMSTEDGKPGPLSCPKSEPDEVQSMASKQLTSNGVKQPTASTHIDPSMDPKRAKRILANRQSAQRSRVRKLQYIAELERSVSALQTEVSALTPQVAFLDHQRLLLNVDNNTIKQRIASLLQDKRFKDAHNDALSREVHHLRQVLQQQHDELRSQQQRQQQQQEEYSGILKAETSSPLSNGFDMDAKPASCLLEESPRHQHSQHHLVDHTEFPE